MVVWSIERRGARSDECFGQQCGGRKKRRTAHALQKTELQSKDHPGVKARPPARIRVWNSNCVDWARNGGTGARSQSAAKIS